MGFKKTVELDYPLEKVFKVFIKAAKKEFPKFNEKNPLGATISKKIKSGSSRTIDIRVEVTAYEKDKLYQITSVRDKLMCVSTYSFEKSGDDKTLFSLEENDNTTGMFAGINTFLQNILFRKRITDKFNQLVAGLQNEIESYDERVQKSIKKEEVDT
ncbi:DUF3284 domain-containing protein [Clostridium sp. Ade.TY]|uniref:DUF3284 domain-containing protein n=1 Tax=Clostridium sp. Ade.TY TaxID=1391647 RepID=UPI00040F309A|nr:DUF3284 domain-containing protein [Clostridium sp. Ade.TY]